MLLYGQTISGTVFEMNTDITVEYVNIGIIGKNTGTVSDQNGKYTLQIKSEHLNDTLIFSSIGYHAYSVKISDFINMNNGNVDLEKRLYDLSEVSISPRKIKQKVLGSNKKNFLSASYCNNIDFETGILISNKNTVFIKEAILNLDLRGHRENNDTIFFRFNIYEAHEDMQFKNILNSPIYVSLPNEDMKDKIVIDLRHQNLVVEGDFLVSIEKYKNSGLLCFYFPYSRSPNIYTRMSSQGTWSKFQVPGVISISVLVDVEK